MNLFVFSNHRALLNFCKEQSNDSPFLAPCKSVSDFFNDIAIFEGAKLPKNLRSLFLWNAIQNFEATNITNLGFDTTFLRFLEGSNFIFKFFDELDCACVKISDIDVNDTYGDYSDHLRILEGIYGAYNDELKKRGFYDYSADFRLNEPYLRAYQHISIYIDGVLSTKEMRILRKCADFTNIVLYFTCTKYNANLLQKMLGHSLDCGYKYSFNLNNGEILQLEKLHQKTQSINLYSFDLRVSQALLVIAKVNEWLGENINKNTDKSANQSNFAVILPDEKFAKYLQLFDETRNLNYAMGFSDDRLIKKLRELRQNCENMNPKELLDYILTHFKLENELEIRAMRDILERLSNDEIIEFLLQSVANLNDNSGGKVGVFGILESRAMSFEGAIIVDFNDEFIPRLNDNDMFLNSRIRTRLNLPTLRDKEDLQRHYYFMLINATKRVEIAFCKNALISSLTNDLRSLPSVRFVESSGDKKWRFFPKERVKDYIDDKIMAKSPLTRLSASAIKTFLECKRKFYFSYLCKNLRGSEEKEEFLGTKIHKFLREMGSEFDLRKIAPLLELSAIDDRLDLEITLLQLKPFFEAQKSALKNGRKIIALEQRKEFKIGDFDFVCVMDRVDKIEDKNGVDWTIQIIDYKLKRDFSVKNEGFLQLLIYKIAFESEYGANRVECLYFDLLKNKAFVMDKDAEAEARAMLDSALLELGGEVDFSKCESKNPCKYCEYVYLCDRY